MCCKVLQNAPKLISSSIEFKQFSGPPAQKKAEGPREGGQRVGRRPGEERGEPQEGVHEEERDP